MTPRKPITLNQQAMLDAVREGRVSWGDPHPNLAARTGWSAPRWLVDGREAMRSEGPTLDSLVERGLVSSPDENQKARAL